MTFHVGWPQAIWILLALTGLIHEMLKHGERKTGEHNVWSTFVATLIAAGLLYWGGFFG